MFMLKSILLAMLMVAGLSIGGSRDAPAVSFDLTQFQWKNRLLLLFAPNRNHPAFEALHQTLITQQAELSDRDVVVFEILESGTSNMDKADLDPQTARFLREKFKVRQGDFSVILIGKDGGIKMSNKNLTQLEEIFGLIDTMPMRREEMRQKAR